MAGSGRNLDTSHLPEYLSNVTAAYKADFQPHFYPCGHTGKKKKEGNENLLFCSLLCQLKQCMADAYSRGNEDFLWNFSIAQ